MQQHRGVTYISPMKCHVLPINSQVLAQLPIGVVLLLVCSSAHYLYMQARRPEQGGTFLSHSQGEEWRREKRRRGEKRTGEEKRGEEV